MYGRGLRALTPQILSIQFKKWGRNRRCLWRLIDSRANDGAQNTAFSQKPEER